MRQTRRPSRGGDSLNRLAVITSFLGGARDRYITYKPEVGLVERLERARRVSGLDGLELCYPADFEDVTLLRRLLGDTGLGVSAVNVRSRRTGRWLRGSFSSSVGAERQEVVDDFRRAIDLAREIGVDRITTCPLNDGHDYSFEADYFSLYQYAEESIAAICAHDRAVRVCIEYKWNDPRTRCLLASAGETLAFCQAVGAANLGVTLDIGHALLAGERPAQSVAMIARAGRLFYVHLNDNDRNWDWDMLPGAFHLLEFVEFVHYLRRAGYTEDWYAYDVATKEMDSVEAFDTVVHLTRRIEALADRLDGAALADLQAARNPARTMRQVYDWLLPA
jgi:xylose isomerase